MHVPPRQTSLLFAPAPKSPRHWLVGRWQAVPSGQQRPPVIAPPCPANTEKVPEQIRAVVGQSPVSSTASENARSRVHVPPPMADEQETTGGGGTAWEQSRPSSHAVPSGT